jgi:hypothetical protein
MDSLVIKAIVLCEQNKLLPRLSAITDQLERCSSLSRAQSQPAVKAFVRLFDESKFDPQVGFNPGNLQLSLSICCPSLPQVDTVDETNAASIVLLGMLGRVGSLGNKCLAVFTNKTGLIVTTMAETNRTGRTKLLVGTGYKAREAAFLFSPSYFKVRGWDVRSEQQTEPELVELQKEQTDALAEEMIQAFWTHVTDVSFYVPHQDLSQLVTSELHGYLCAGLVERGVRQGFAPAIKLPPFYLHGTSGVGKSEFVKVFCIGLQHVLERYLAPGIKVADVKVPLNAYTPETLGSVASVRGISDFSIERLIEQTVAKAGVCIVHMEEIPASAELQTALFQVLTRVFKKLDKNYPKAKGRVCRVLTSNFEACEYVLQDLDKGGEVGAKMVQVLGPGWDLRVQWATARVQRLVETRMLDVGLVKEQRRRCGLLHEREEGSQGEEASEQNGEAKQEEEEETVAAPAALRRVGNTELPVHLHSTCLKCNFLNRFLKLTCEKCRAPLPEKAIEAIELVEVIPKEEQLRVGVRLSGGNDETSDATDCLKGIAAGASYDNTQGSEAMGMRSLKTWGEVLAFFVGDHLLAHIPNAKDEGAEGKAGAGEVLSLDVVLGGGAESMLVQVGWKWEQKDKPADDGATFIELPPLELISHDGTIFYPVEQPSYYLDAPLPAAAFEQQNALNDLSSCWPICAVCTFVNPENVTRCQVCETDAPIHYGEHVRVPVDDCHRLQSLSNLFAVNCLRPTVLMLTGSTAATAAYARFAVQAAAHTVQGQTQGAGEIRRFNARIVDEIDVEMVMGNKTQVRPPHTHPLKPLALFLKRCLFPGHRRAVRIFARTL